MSGTAPNEVIISGTLCLTQISKSALILILDGWTIRLTPKGAGLIPVSFSNGIKEKGGFAGYHFLNFFGNKKTLTKDVNVLKQSDP